MRIFGKGKCKLIANCANFWQGKCKFIANFSAKMVTSLPSLSLSLSLSVSLSLSHRKYLTHNIGSASALPIILVVDPLISKKPAQCILDWPLEQFMTSAIADMDVDISFRPSRTS